MDEKLCECTVSTLFNNAQIEAAKSGEKKKQKKAPIGNEKCLFELIEVQNQKFGHTFSFSAS